MPSTTRPIIGFLTLAKFGSLVCRALLACDGFRLLRDGGFFSALVLFILICAAGYFLLR